MHRIRIVDVRKWIAVLGVLDGLLVHVLIGGINVNGGS